MKKRFIFDEGYIKKYAKKDKTKWLIIGVVSLALILVLIILIMANRKPKKPSFNGKPVFEIKEELIVEAGSNVPEAVDYFKKLENIDSKSIKIEYPEDFEISYDTSACSDEDNEKMSNGANVEDFACVEKTLKTIATYGVSIIVQDKEYTVRLVVTDSSAPILSTKKLEIYAGNTYDIKDFVSFCVDATGTCEVYYSENDVDEAGNKIDYTKYTDPGTYKIRMYAKDSYGNTTDIMETELTILQTDAPMYTVTFNSNGGSAVNAVKVPEGGTIEEPGVPTKSGYTFAGWFNGNNKFDFTTGINSNITLTARWNKDGETPPGPVTPGTISVKSVSLDFKKINLVIGDAKTVTAYIYPGNASDKNIVWSSANPNVATVSNGKITGVKAGTTSITASVGGKSASVEVVVRDNASATCSYGDASYNTSYILSVNLIQNNCAVDPNETYNEANSVAAREIKKATSELTSMGFSMNYISVKDSNYRNVKNNAGTGIVGIQITITITAIDPQNPYIAMTAEYIIKPDGSRQMLKNNIQKDGISFR